MAVYKKTYRRYDGALTPGWSRFLVLPRYTFEEMRRSRFFTIFFLGTMIMPVVCALIIYLRHNLSALQVLQINPDQIVAIDARFFMFFLGFQSMLALFLAAFIGPGLVAPDLANNALALYLARPFDRRDYVLGRLWVLLVLFSLMTWAPGLLLLALQGYLEGAGWLGANLHIGVALFFGAWIWMLVLSLLVLALSAWVKWKPVAGGLLFVVFFATAAFGHIVNETLDTKWGHLVNLSQLIGTVWLGLFGQPAREGAGAVFFRIQEGGATPAWTAWASLAIICAICLALLGRKIRGLEVVR